MIMMAGFQTIGMALLPLIGAMSSLVILVFMVGCLYFMCRRWLLSITIAVIPMIMLVVSDYVINLFMLQFFNLSTTDIQNDYLLEGVVGIMLLTFALCYLGRYLFGTMRDHEPFFRRYGILLTGMVVIILLIFYLNIWIGQQQGFSNENIRANSILFLFYFILLIGVCFVLIRIMMKETDLQNRQVQYDRLTEYTENLEQLYMDMQKFRHDYINILLTMSEYIRSGDVERLARYFNERIMPISQGMQSNNYKLGALHNVKLQELKGILSSKLIKAQELKIDAVIEVVEPIEQINMDSVQLCRCLGIILDNAIEEAIQCEKPNVRVAVIKRDPSVLIAVTNSCRSNTPELYRIFERGFSTKGTNRGLGLSNLKEIVAKSESTTLDTQILNGEFIQLLEVHSAPVTTKSRMTG
ncbi:histidine kinase [Paenibacillus sp. CCS19]|nr:histidine kinase [Paenibacillus cellulosilyticus]